MFRSKMVHVLIADDHKGVRENLRSLLREQQPSWEIYEASNGTEAVEQFRKNTPDVAVLDVVMNPVGGVAAAYEIRRIDPTANIHQQSLHREGRFDNHSHARCGSIRPEE